MINEKQTLKSTRHSERKRRIPQLQSAKDWNSNPWVWVIKFKQVQHPSPSGEGTGLPAEALAKAGVRPSHPIIFSTPMVKAILANRKTQTRRIVKGTPLEWLQDGFTPDFTAMPENDLCPYGKPGDLLWVRETWCDYNEGYIPELKEDKPHYIYKADNALTDIKGIWKPSIHMPKAATRIWLEITDLTVQALQEITEEDAIEEGIEPDPTGSYYYKNYSKEGFKYILPIESFRTLWDSINAQRTTPSPLERDGVRPITSTNQTHG